MSTNALEDSGKWSIRFPIKLIIWTFVAILVTFLVYQNIDQLNEQFNWDMATPTIVGVVLFLITWSMWISWAVLRLGSIVTSLAIFALPVLFFSLTYIDFGGDGQVAFRPRFWNWKSENYLTLDDKTSTGIDLKTKTPYDFQQFLGPDRNLKVDSGVQLDVDWQSSPPEMLWKIDVGDAWSGFAVVNGFAVTQEQRGAEECVTCYNVLTGELEWIYKATRRHEDALAMGKVGPRATPTIHQGRVYTTGGNGILDCLDGRDGSLLWTANVPELVGIDLIPRTNSLGFDYAAENSSLMWGRSCSPLIYNNTVIVSAGGPLSLEEGADDPTCTLIAFDVATGDEVWRGGTRRISYGSPSLVKLDGKVQVVVMAEEHAVGHDPDTGDELWAFARFGSSSGEANCSQVNYVGDHRFLLTKGYRLGGELISVVKDDQGIWETSSLAKNSRLLNTKMTNPVVDGDFAWALSDGFISCVHLMDKRPWLKREWRERTRFGHGQLLAVGDKLLIHGEDGVLALAELNPEKFEKLAQIDTVQGFCWNTIAIYGDLVLVRSEREAACYRLPIKGDSIPNTVIEEKSDADKSGEAMMKDGMTNFRLWKSGTMAIQVIAGVVRFQIEPLKNPEFWRIQLLQSSSQFSPIADWATVK